MFHLIKYSVIRKVKNFSMLFWPCMFPLILGTLFYFAFGNISESDFETVQAAFVEENPGDSVFPSFLEEVSKEGQKKKRCRSLRIRKSPEFFMEQKRLI